MNPISQSSEHATRALTYLAHDFGGAYHLARDMGEELGIPAPFLSKILRPLVSRGILESQRGRGGGFRLRLPPREVTLYQIVDSQEHLSDARRCFLGQSECTDQRACPMHDYWKAASEEMSDKLENTTLQDLVGFCDENPNSGYPNPKPGPGRKRGSKARRGRSS